MKKEILMLIIGILIGAIIATGVFLVLQNNNTSSVDRDFSENGGMQRGNMSSMDTNNIPDDLPNDMDSDTSESST